MQIHFLCDCRNIRWILPMFQTALVLGILLGSPGRSLAQTNRVDPLGDPLPVDALIRMGTHRFRHPDSVAEIALSPDENTVVSVGRQMIAWDAMSGKEKWRTDLHKLGVRISAASYGSKPIVFGASSDRFFTIGKADEFIIWDTQTGEYEIKKVKRFLPRLRMVLPKSIDVTSDGQRMALGASTGVTVCDESGKIKFQVANKIGRKPRQLGRDRLWFGGEFSHATFSPNEKQLLITTSDSPQVIRIHDVAKGKEEGRIALTENMVRYDFTPDGSQIAVTERDSSIRIYDLETKERVWARQIDLNNPFENYTSAVAYAANGKSVAVCATDHLIYLFDAVDGHLMTRLEGHKWYPWSVRFTQDSEKLFSSGWDGTIRRWDLREEKQLGLPNGYRASAVTAISPHGKVMAFADDMKTIHLVDATDGTEIKQLESTQTVYSQVIFARDSRRLAAGGQKGENIRVEIWNLASGNMEPSWEWPQGGDPHSKIEDLHFSPDGKYLAAAVFRQDSAYVWDLQQGKLVAEMDHNEIYGLDFSIDGSRLYTAGWDSAVRVWDLHGNSLEMHQVDVEQENADLRMYTVCVCPVSGLIATAHMNAEVRIWDSDMTLQRKFSVGNRFVFGSMSFSPDGLWLATGNTGGDVVVWDPRTGQQVWQASGHQGYVYTVGFGRDSRSLLSGGRDGCCYLWNVQPQVEDTKQDVETLWVELHSDDSSIVFQALWKLSQNSNETVRFLAEKLQPDGIALTKMTEVVSLRIVALLSQIRSPLAIRLLKQLANKNAETNLGAQAKNAIRRLRQ